MDQEKIMSKGGVSRLGDDEITEVMLSQVRVELVEQAKEIAARYGAEPCVLNKSVEEVYSWVWHDTDAYAHSPKGSLRAFYKKNMAEYRELQKKWPYC